MGKTKLLTVNFWDFGTLKPDTKKFHIKAKWEPKEPVEVVGAQLGLLCNATTVELYICVSRIPDIGDIYPYKEMKTDYLFYAQRDAYAQPSGIADILSWQMLPAGSHFEVSRDLPVYVKVGAVNFGDEPIDYDAFVNLYYRRSNA